MKTVTAGRDYLGEFAPKFAELNDDILFGEVWSREKELSARDRSLITVTALLAQGLCDSSFGYHLKAAKENGITRSEIAEIITHAAFYAGWPKAWAAFRLAKNVWTEADEESEKQKHENSMSFPIGEPNTGFSKYFTGQSYLAPVSKSQIGIFNVKPIQSAVISCAEKPYTGIYSGNDNNKDGVHVGCNVLLSES